MISSLKSEHGIALEHDYAEGQVNYQKGNEALFRTEIENGTDPDLKDFARATLPKIVDHLDRALKLAGEKTESKCCSFAHSKNEVMVGLVDCLCPTQNKKGGSWPPFFTTKSQHLYAKQSAHGQSLRLFQAPLSRQADHPM
jgi:hypothetical protein